MEAYALQLLENPDTAIWTEVDEICDAAVAEDSGIPLDELDGWMNGWGQPDGPPPPR